MRHYLALLDIPDLPPRAFKKALGRRGPATLEGGGGKGSSRQPDAPDPYAVAGATTQTNQDTAAYNKALNLNNYTNPFGSQQSTQVGTDPQTGAPIYNTSITANPQLQQALSSLLGQASGSGSSLSGAQSGLSDILRQYQQLNSGLNDVGTWYSGVTNGLTDLSGQLSMNDVKNAQQQGQNAAYAAQTQYLDPQYSQQKESLDAQLANQGITPGSQAYQNAMTNYNNQKQQAYSNAQNQAIMTGSQIGAQNLQNQISGVNTQASLLGQKAQTIGSMAGLYGQQAQNLGAQAAGYGQLANLGQLPYSNLSSIASLIPGYAGPAQSSSSPANIGSNIYSNYQAQLNQANAAQQSANQFTGGLFGLGSAGILGYAMSDRRAKRDIRRIGRLHNGLPWYSFRYVWDDERAPRRQGVMADEARRIVPSAVATHVSGLQMVDYAQVM